MAKYDDLYINDSGTWKNPEHVYINDNGTWREPDNIWVNDAGTWRKVTFDVFAVDFDGVNDYIIMNRDYTTYRQGGTEESNFEFYFKLEKLSGTQHIFDQGPATYRADGYILSNGAVGFEVVVNGTSYEFTTSSGLVSAGNTYKINFITRRSGENRIYINDVDRGSRSQASTQAVGTFYVGRRYTGINYLQCQMYNISLRGGTASGTGRQNYDWDLSALTSGTNSFPNTATSYGGTSATGYNGATMVQSKA